MLATTALVAAFAGDIEAANQVDPEKPHVHERTDDITVAAAEPPLNRAGWTAVASTQQGIYPASNVLDGNNGSFWHSQYPGVPHPHAITVDMNNSNTVSALRYLPRADHANGRIGGYQIHVSSSGAAGSWNLVASGTFVDTGAEKTVPLSPTIARFVRLTALSEAGNRGAFTSAAEINITGTPAPTLSRANWTASATSQQSIYPASNVLDSNTGTKWHTAYNVNPPITLPQSITLAMPTVSTISGLRYLPRTDHPNGRIGGYQIHLSANGTEWGSPIATGTFADTGAEKTVPFTPTTAQFVKLTALSEAGNRGAFASAAEINLTGVAATTLPRVGWTAAASTQHSSYPAGNAIDGNDSTFWHSFYNTSGTPHPHAITVDMKASNVVSGLRYLPRVDSPNGRIGGYQIHVSTGGAGGPWTLVAAGAFPDTAPEKYVPFTPVAARWVKLTSLSEAGNRGAISSAAEINLVGASPTANPRLSGAWNETIGFPLIPVAAGVLPNGKLLAWSAHQPDNYTWPGPSGLTQTATWNPATGAVSKLTVTNTSHDMFCPGIAALADGRILVNGGSDAAKTSIYDPATESWTTGQPMTIPRGYQSSVTLSDGRVFTLGGSWNGGPANKNGEVWSASTGWQKLPGVSVVPMLTAERSNHVNGPYFRADNHGWFFGASNGRVFHAGPSKQMNWIDTNGNGSITPAGNRGDDQDAMNGNAVMYDVGKILTISGAPTYEYTSATKNAYVIDINGATPVVNKVGQLAHPRAYHNSVVLPDGKVLALGGQRIPIVFSENDSAFAPELWDPATGTFTAMAPMNPVPRNYHSVALLLPDGRVFAGGGGLCGNCNTNHPDGQIYSPPYLFGADGKPAPRPAITSAPSAVTAGETITVSTDRAVTGFSLVRMGTATHSVNTDQRRVPLTPTSAGGTSYSLTVPADRGVVLPGYYMLFAMDANGVPSVAATVKVS